MIRAAQAAGVLLAVVVLMLVAALPQAEAGRWPDNYGRSTYNVVPFYDITAGHASFLLIHRPGFRSSKAFDETVFLNFYDQTCAKKADQQVKLTVNDTAFLNVAKLNPAAPTQGAIFLSGGFDGVDTGAFNSNGIGQFVDVVNVDFTAGTATLLNSIITQTVGGFTHFFSGSTVTGTTNFLFNETTADWALYTLDFVIVTFGPKEAAPFSTTITLSCPRSELGAQMNSVVGTFATIKNLDGVNSGSAGNTGLRNFGDDFVPATGTTTTVLDIFVYDTDEHFLGSIHNITCRCFERNALKTWVPQALTSDVVVYFHGASSTGADRSIAGFQETDFISGATKLHASTYLHHGFE